MGYSNQKLKNDLLLFILSFLTSCGYVERDRVEFKIDVVGNINLTKSEISDKVNLNFSESPQSDEMIVINCGVVIYDSLNNQILVEKVLTKINSTYYRIKIEDALALKSSAGIKTEIIQASKFDELMKKANGLRWDFYKR